MSTLTLNFVNCDLTFSVKMRPMQSMSADMCHVCRVHCCCVHDRNRLLVWTILPKQRCCALWQGPTRHIIGQSSAQSTSPPFETAQ